MGEKLSLTLPDGCLWSFISCLGYEGKVSICHLDLEVREPGTLSDYKDIGGFCCISFMRKAEVGREGPLRNFTMNRTGGEMKQPSTEWEKNRKEIVTKGDVIKVSGVI